MDQSYIKLSNELLIVSEDDSKDFMIIDPKTSGVLDTYSAEAKLASKKIIVSNRFGHILAHLKEKSILEFYNTGNLKPYLRCSLPEVLTSFALSNDNYLFYGGGSSGILYIWDTMTGEQVKRIKAHPKTLNKIVISEDGGLIVTTGADFVINVYLYSQIFAGEVDWRLEMTNHSQDTYDIKPYYTMIGHMGAVTDLILSPKSNGKLISCSTDKTCIFWDCYKGSMIKTIQCGAEVLCMHYDAVDDRIYLGCKNSKIIMFFLTHKSSDLILETEEKAKSIPNKFDVRKQYQDRVEFTGHDGEVTNLVYNAELGNLISAGGDGKIIFWNIDGKIVKQIHLFKKAVANLILFERPAEYDSSLTIAQKIKKAVEFKAFRKHEEKSSGNIDSHVVSIHPEQKTMRESESIEHASSILHEFLDCTMDFYLHEQSTSSKPVSVGESNGNHNPKIKGNSELERLREENTKLKALTQQLFNKGFLQ